jgi:hypothetical protein
MKLFRKFTLFAHVVQIYFFFYYYYYSTKKFFFFSFFISLICNFSLKYKLINKQIKIKSTSDLNDITLILFFLFDGEVKWEKVP